MSTTLRAETMAGGAFLEAVDYALEKALANVLDPNTDAKKPRKITATITIRPDANRDMGNLSFEVKESLAAPVPVETSIIIDRDRKSGKAVGAELRKGENPSQHQLMDAVSDLADKLGADGVEASVSVNGGKALPFRALGAQAN